MSGYDSKQHRKGPCTYGDQFQRGEIDKKQKCTVSWTGVRAEKRNEAGWRERACAHGRCCQRRAGLIGLSEKMIFELRSVGNEEAIMWITQRQLFQSGETGSAN